MPIDAEMRESMRLENQRMFTTITEVGARDRAGGEKGAEMADPVVVEILLSC